MRRTLRIFPLYYLFLFIYYFIKPLLFGTTSIGFGEQIYYYTYLQNFAATFGWDTSGPGHYWSLAVEEHFYLFWPLVVFKCSEKNLKKVIYLIVVFALLLRMIMVQQGYNVFFFTFTRFDSLAAGALLALLELENVFTPQNAKRFLGVFVGVLISTVLLWVFMTSSANSYLQMFKFILLTSVYFLLIGYLLSVSQDHSINKILKHKYMIYTGKISYGLYVYHKFAYSLTLFYIPFQHWYINLILGIALAYAIATISFYLFETSFLKLKKYFEY